MEQKSHELACMYLRIGSKLPTKHCIGFANLNWYGKTFASFDPHLILTIDVPILKLIQMQKHTTAHTETKR